MNGTTLTYGQIRRAMQAHERAKGPTPSQIARARVYVAAFSRDELEMVVRVRPSHYLPGIYEAAIDSLAARRLP